MCIEEEIMDKSAVSQFHKRIIKFQVRIINVPDTMNRKNFIATIGVVAGGALTGLSRPAAGATANYPFSLPGNKDELWKVIRQEDSREKSERHYRCHGKR